MREILDNARYAPTVGRYKVYLIDEVHMLSKAAFNSMLKTLEEPPEHVRFVLATTDPQKIPVTVLSRCLQFNLKPLSPPVDCRAPRAHPRPRRSIAYDAGAVALIARAAQGSLRDGLSLLDQAIAFGGGEVKEGVVRTMLGTVDREYVYRIADALAAGDGHGAACRKRRARRARPRLGARAGGACRRCSIALPLRRSCPRRREPSTTRSASRAYARRFPAETVQLHYQIAAQGRADLALAPDEATGFAMTLLRMLAFAPGRSAGAQRRASSAPPRRRRARRGADRRRRPAIVAPMTPRCRLASTPTAAAARSGGRCRPTSPHWPGFVAQLKLTGMAAQLAAQTELKSIAGNALTLALPVASQAPGRQGLRRQAQGRARAGDRAQAAARLRGRRAVPIPRSPPRRSASAREARAKREAAFRDEPFVRDLLAKFDGQVKTDTITPLSRDGEPK